MAARNPNALFEVLKHATHGNAAVIYMIAYLVDGRIVRKMEFDSGLPTAQALADLWMEHVDPVIDGAPVNEVWFWDSPDTDREPDARAVR